MRRGTWDELVLLRGHGAWGTPADECPSLAGVQVSRSLPRGTHGNENPPEREVVHLLRGNPLQEEAALQETGVPGAQETRSIRGHPYNRGHPLQGLRHKPPSTREKRTQ